MESLEGIAAADAHLGRPVPLPTAPVPLARWTEVRAAGPGGVQVEWNLDDTRTGSPGRLVLYAGTRAPGAQLPADQTDARQTLEAGGRQVILHSAPLAEAQPSLRPVRELCWQANGLHLRLTAQGPWSLDDLLAIVTSIGAATRAP